MVYIFWISLSIIFYVYAGYPLIVGLLSFFHKMPVRKKTLYPSVSVLISAYNEEKNIENKLFSLLHLNYPKEKLEILIGSDGSTDKTDGLIKKIISVSSAPAHQCTRNIRFFRQGLRQGKPSMLNMLASEARGEILVFTDARQRLDKNSVAELVKNFADHKVGSVSAELYLEEAQGKASGGIGLYWRYEKFIRRCESDIGSMLGATGAMYAIRKELFCRLPEDLVLDDVYIPLKIVQKGYRAVFEPEARIYDRVTTNAKEEFSRKARTLAGNFQIFRYLSGLFNPIKSPVAWQLFSHKFLRLIAPFLLAAVFISNIFILGSFIYRFIFIGQVIFYTLALFGVSVPYMFCVMNQAAVAGLYRFLKGSQDVLWEKAK